jgi:signal transduction histidine kinase
MPTMDYRSVPTGQEQSQSVSSAIPTRTPPSARPTSETAAAFDLTEKFARLEEQFAQLKARVRQAQQLSTLGVAAAMIVHEFNNLLTPVVGYGKSALETDDAAFLRKALQRAVSSVELAVSLSDRLLKLNAAKATERQVVGVRVVVEEAYACLCRDLSRDGITVTFDVDESLKVWADPLQVQQVFYNLFLNAREAMKGGHHGRLTVRARRTLNGADECHAVSPSNNPQAGGNASPDQEPRLKGNGNDSDSTLPAVMIDVCNTGKPIPAELLPHIFDAFESTKSSEGEGAVRCSGLGLALCRDLIEENGGRISVTSDETAGTTFHIAMPTASNPYRV